MLPFYPLLDLFSGRLLQASHSTQDAAALERHVELPEAVPAPVEEGGRLGTLTLSAGGEVLATVPLTASYAVERLSAGGVLKNMFLRLFGMAAA